LTKTQFATKIQCENTYAESKLIYFGFDLSLTEVQYSTRKLKPRTHV